MSISSEISSNFWNLPQNADLELSREKVNYNVRERGNNMNITPQQAQKLLISNYKSSHLGFSMLLTRLKGLFAKDPTTLQSSTVEINTFLQKYSMIMQKEYSNIINL